MKRKALLALALLPIVIGGGLLVANLDAVHWWVSSRLHAPAGYEWHAARDCPHAAPARELHHEALRSRAQSEEQGLTWTYAYLRHYPDGPHALAAHERVDDETWRESLEFDVVTSYLTRFPEGRHAAEAKLAILESHWTQAESYPSIAGYQTYLSVAPDGEHAEQARARIEELAWEAVRATDYEGVVLDYLAARPDGPHAEEARARLDDVRYQLSLSSSQAGEEIDRILVYLELHPDGRNVGAARGRLESALAERVRAVAAGDAGAPRLDGYGAELLFVETGDAVVDEATHHLLAYLREFPAGELGLTARAQLEERLWARAAATEDIRVYGLYQEHFAAGERGAVAREAAEGIALEGLRARGEVAVVATGSGISALGAELAWLGADAAPAGGWESVPDGVTVRIPAGTYFAAGDAGVQSMLSYRTARLRLHHGRTTGRVDLSVACANKYRAIPSSADPLAFAGAPPSGDLERIARAIDEAAAPYAVAQAAIWIVSDDASASGLRDLVWQTTGGSVTGSVIQPADMGRALDLCLRAGIDLGARAIWQDRLELREHVSAETRALLGGPETLLEAARFGTASEFALLLGEGAATLGDVLFEVLARDDEELVRALARSEPDKDALLRTALRRERGNWTALLLELGADPVEPDPFTGETPLDLAATTGDLEAVRLLLDRGAAVEGGRADLTALGRAAASGAMPVVLELLEHGAEVDGGDQTALMWAVRSGSVELVELLLDRGADVGRQSRDDGDAWTALAWACVESLYDTGVVELLLRRGADPDAGTATRSPLQLAAESGRAETARVLLAAGADPEARPAGTPAPLELAEECLRELEALPYPFPTDLESARALVELLGDGATAGR